MTTSHDSAELEAIQGVVDRVSSYQDGAPESTVESELSKAADEAGIELGDADLAKLAAAIEEAHASVDAASVLG